LNENDEIIVLYDENGNEQNFEFLDTIEMDSGTYVALAPFEGDDEELDEDEEVEVLFMKIEPDPENDGEEILTVVEDEDELDAVFEEFQQRMEDYEIVDDEDEEEEEDE